MNSSKSNRACNSIHFEKMIKKHLTFDISKQKIILLQLYALLCAICKLN